MDVQTAFLFHTFLLFYVNNVLDEFILLYELTHKDLGDFLKNRHFDIVHDGVQTL